MKYRELSCRLLVGVMLMATASVNTAATTEPYRNPALTADERAADLLHRMTLQEKISQMCNSAGGVERLGIPAYDWWNEALHGVGRAGLATVFPQAIGMAATFDDAAVFNTFSMVSDEARAKHHDFKRRGERSGYKGLTFWTPNVNIFRDPRWGRGQETYGEDPYLSSRMGVAVVKGLQGDGSGKYDKTHACAKHYAVHSGPEWNRHSFNAGDISARDLQETYLPAFKALVTEAGVKEVMCAYNRFEGEPCCSSKKLLMQILRDEWGYDDIVVSDCGAISDFYRPKAHGTHTDAAEASADAVISGTDLECGGSYHSLAEAVEKGAITEEQIDKSVFRLLRAKIQLGMLDDDSIVEWAAIPYSVVNSGKHQRQAEEMARKSIVLLSNKNQTLPLSKKIRKIALIGPAATDSVMMWGNYNGSPAHTVTLLEGLRTKMPEAEIIYTKGCDYVDNLVMNSVYDHCAIDGAKGFKGEFWNNREMSGEPVSKAQYVNPLNFNSGGGTHFTPGVNLTDFSARFETVFTPTESGNVTFYLAGDDGTRLYVSGERVIDDWGHGSAREKTYTMSVEAGKEYPLMLEYWQGGGVAELRFDLGNKCEIDCDAVAAGLADADVILYAGGISPKLEGEEMRVDYSGFRGGDRTDIELPRVQKQMLKSLKKLGKPVVFLLTAGSALALTEENDLADAIVDIWYPGQAGGTAAADVLFGDYNPAGRLPITFYASSSDLPDYEDYDMYGRTYRYFEGIPLYEFGHGLSYTDFEYGDAKLSDKALRKGKTVTLEIPVANTGDRDGDEVVQVYIVNPADKYGPKKSLRAFRRVNIPAGSVKNVAITLGDSEFEFFNPKTERMERLSGRYEILYGGSSSDKSLKKIPIKLK